MHDDADQSVLKTALIHGGLFLATVATVSFQGIQFVGQTAVTLEFWPLFQQGLVFALLLLAFLGAHEFGHYFAAVYHKVKVTLPYFIPLPLLFIGTFGAVIRIKEPVYSTKKLYDIGIAGPLAGFIVSLIILLIGFATMPGPEHVKNFAGHEDTIAYVDATGQWPTEATPSPDGETLVLGNTLLYMWLASFFENVPPMWEMYHYPFLFAGWLGLFFTALNLLPLGQLDGGHILYSLIGSKRHRIAARIVFVGLVLFAGVGVVPFVHELISQWDTRYATLSWSMWGLASFAMFHKAYKGDFRWMVPAWVVAFGGAILYSYYVSHFDAAAGYLMWGVWSLFILFGSGIEHPPVMVEEELSRGRKILGWLSMAVFVVCITLSPISILF